MPDSYPWSVEGAPVRIELEREAARRLREAVAAAGPQEIGGFLLGTVQAGVTHVSGFQLVECEHRRGEAYDLTPLDRLRFSRRCSPWLNKRPNETRAVGFFRTHVRPGLFLDEHDFRTVQEFFADPNQVVLLVRPEPAGSPVAGFFFWEAGDMERSKSYRPFPLDDAAAAAPVSPPVAPLAAREGPPAPADSPGALLPAVRTQALTPPASEPPARRPQPDSSWKYGLVAACIPLAAGLAYFAGRHQAPHAPATPAPVAQASQAPASPATPFAEPAAAPVQNGTTARTGNLSPAPVVARFPMAEKKSPMDTPPGLAAARARRAPVEEPDWTASLPPNTNAPASYRNGAYQTGQGLHGGVRVVNSRGDQPQPGSSPNAGSTPQQPPSETARLENRPEPINEPEPNAPSPERPAQRFRPELHPAITVEAEDPTSGLGHKLVRFPKRILTLGLGGHENFVPPRPLHEVAPSVPPRVAQELTDVVPITVRIAVDTAGRVRGTELISGAADPQLADLALNAARKWEFVAARQNNTPVPSSVVAHFRFRPPQQ